ncbi:MAG: OmpA family protein, partial [Bacteroidota bacterium]
AGIGAYTEIFDDFVPVLPLGVNLNFNLGSDIYLSPNASYRLALSDTDVRDNLQLGLGLHIPLDPAAPKLPPQPVITDTDGDGLADNADQCPTEAGPASTLGCPDTDGDGIADKDDDCPEVAGLTQFKGCADTDGDGVPDPTDKCPDQAGPEANDGCPIADSDGDGTPDAEDQCPDQPGVLSLLGCPDSDGDGVADKDDDCPNAAGPSANRGCPDTDGDGVMDKDDSCPTVAGPASNRGCPEITQEDQETIDFAIQNINFETASATITAESRSVLDRVEDILRRYPGYKLAIGGHTDSIGSAEANMSLSERRAKSVYDYLIAKGISANRMTYQGFGETLPIADNRYKDGREQNRRVTLDLSIE